MERDVVLHFAAHRARAHVRRGRFRDRRFDIAAVAGQAVFAAAAKIADVNDVTAGGEQEFRRAERAALREVLEELSRGPARIVALGGGAFVQKGNAELLKAARVPSIFLDAPVEELWRRCQEQAGKDGAHRPLLGNKDRFCALYGARHSAYSKASLRVETGRRNVEEIADEIARTLGLPNWTRGRLNVTREGAND